MLNHRYSYPIIPVTGDIVTQGHFGDLKALKGAHSIGIYDSTTYHIATGSGNGTKFFIGYSSEALDDSLDRWHFGRTDGKKTEEFRGKDIISFQYSNPAQTVAEKWTVGYDGVTACNSAEHVFECGRTYGLLVNLSGSPTWRRWAKNLLHRIYVTTPCCDSSECETGCPDNKFDCEYIYKEFAKRINEHVELSLMGVKAKYITSTMTPTALTHYDYNLYVPDAYKSVDLAAVKKLVDNHLGTTTTKVTREKFRNNVTKYVAHAVLEADGDTLPVYTPEGYYAAATCGECPEGFAFTQAKDLYTLVKDASSTDSLSAIAGDYTASQTHQIATADVNTTTEVITVAGGHNFTTGQAVTYYANGTVITNLVDETTYYVVSTGSTTFKLALTYENAVAGSPVVINLGGTGNNNQVFSAANVVETSVSPTVKIYTISVDAGTTVASAQGTDSIISAGTQSAGCVPPAGCSYSWEKGAGYFKTTRELCMKLHRTDCNIADNTGEFKEALEALVAEDESIVGTAGSKVTFVEGDDCADKYTIEQYSNPLAEGCLSTDPTAFQGIPEGYSTTGVPYGQAGVYLPQGYTTPAGEVGIWEVIPETIPAYSASKKCGLEITAQVTERYLSDCAMELKDFYEVEPIRIEVSWVVDQMTGLPEACDTKAMPQCKRIRPGQYQRQSGEWLLREYLKAGAYDFTACDDSTARMREILDQNRRQQIDRKALYKLYYITYKSNKGNEYNFDQKPEVWETVVAFKEGDPKAAAFETAFGQVLNKFGVSLAERA